MFGWNHPNTENVIDSRCLERAFCEKTADAFSQHARSGQLNFRRLRNMPRRKVDSAPPVGVVRDTKSMSLPSSMPYWRRAGPFCSCRNKPHRRAGPTSAGSMKSSFFARLLRDVIPGVAADRRGGRRRPQEDENLFGGGAGADLLQRSLIGLITVDNVAVITKTAGKCQGHACHQDRHCKRYQCLPELCYVSRKGNCFLETHFRDLDLPIQEPVQRIGLALALKPCDA